MVEKRIIAIIPARGGSKRIPKKNIIELGGKPMIAWTIEAALKSKYITRVIVSTDDEEIASISKKFGAEVPFLRDKNADNHAPISLATIYSLKQLENTELARPDVVVQLMANCPIRDEHDIDTAIENFISKGKKFQISCFKYGWMNPWWAHSIDKNGKAFPVFTEGVKGERSQDQKTLYCPTGAIWIAETESLYNAGTFYGKDYSFFPIHWIKAIDIDEYEDLEMADFFIRAK